MTQLAQNKINSDVLDKLSIHKSWHDIMLPLFNNPHMFLILEKLHKKHHCPKKSDIFKAFTVPFEDVKIVMLGQDPYPNPKFAIGTAFAVPNEIDNMDIPPSLSVILDALADQLGDITIGYNEYEPFDKTLQHWKDQGILLLNSALSCEVGNSSSHQEDWRFFIKEILNQLNKRNALIFVFLGKVAKSFMFIVDDSRHYILQACHPVAEYRGSGNFNEHGIFKEIDRITTKLNNETINWI